jgi:hypothetical protein
MAKVKQLTVSLENQPGRLAAVAKVLADSKVSILGILGSTAGTQGSVQVVVDNMTEGKKALSAARLVRGRNAGRGGAPQQVGSTCGIHCGVGQEGHKHRRSVWHGAQRSKEIGAVFRHLNAGRGVRELSSLHPKIRTAI